MIKIAKEHIGLHYLLTKIYFESFGIQYIPEEILKKIKDKSITNNIFRVQDNKSIMCRLYCIPFIVYMPL